MVEDFLAEEQALDPLFPFGNPSLNASLFKRFYLESFDMEAFKDLAHKGDLLKSGSRTFAWRLFLGLVPEEYNF
jgi:hypothetical protein